MVFKYQVGTIVGHLGKILKFCGFLRLPGEKWKKYRGRQKKGADSIHLGWKRYSLGILIGSLSLPVKELKGRDNLEHTRYCHKKTKPLLDLT